MVLINILAIIRSLVKLPSLAFEKRNEVKREKEFFSKISFVDNWSMLVEADLFVRMR